MDGKTALNSEPGKVKKAEATRSNILKAASKLFLKKGIKDTTVRDIAHEAGVTTGAIYHHFSSKDEIAQALGLAKRGDFARIFAEVDEEGAPLATLMRFLKRLIQYELIVDGKEMSEYRLKNRRITARSLDSSVEGLHPQFDIIRGLIQKAQLSGLLDPAWPCSEIEKSIVLELWNIRYDIHISKTPFDYKEELESRISLVLRAFAPGTYEMRNWWKSRS